MKSIYPVLLKTNTSLTSHRVIIIIIFILFSCLFIYVYLFADLNVKTTQKDVIELYPFIRRKFVLKPVSTVVFQDNRGQVRGTRPSFRWRLEHSEERGPRSAVRNLLFTMQPTAKGSHRILQRANFQVLLGEVVSLGSYREQSMKLCRVCCCLLMPQCLLLIL